MTSFDPRVVEVRIPHGLPGPAAARRAREAARLLARRYQRARPRVVWVDDRHATVDVRLAGMVVHVFVALEPGELVVRARVPLALSVFAPLARARVAEEASRWLSEAGPAPASPEA